VEPGGTGGSRDGASATYFGRVASNPGHFRAAAPVSLLVVKLQILQPLGQGQFLLYGHTQEGVQSLFLVLCFPQLPLHLIQLNNVLITSTERERERERETEVRREDTQIQSVSIYVLTFTFPLKLPLLSPCGKHGPERREGGGIFFQSLQLVPQLLHGLCHHRFLILVFALQIRQSALCCLR